MIDPSIANINALDGADWVGTGGVGVDMNVNADIDVDVNVNIGVGVGINIDAKVDVGIGVDVGDVDNNFSRYLLVFLFISTLWLDYFCAF